MHKATESLSLQSPCNSNEEQLLRSAMSSIDAVAWQWDLDKSAFSYCSSLVGVLGLEEEQNQNLLTRVSEKDQCKLLQCAEKSHHSNEVFEQLVHIHIGHDAHPFRIIGSRVDSAEGESRRVAGIVLAGVDTGFLLNSVLNNASILVFVKGLQGHYLFVNQKYAEHCQIDQQLMLGKTDIDLFGEKAARHLQRFEKWIIQSTEPVQIEEVLPLGPSERTYLSGRFPIQDSRGVIYALGGVFTDISQIKTFEHTIKKQSEELNQVLNAIPAQIWHMGSYGEVKGINQQVSDALGISIHTIKNRTLLEIRPALHNAEERQRNLLQVLRTGKPLFESIEQQEGDGYRSWSRVDMIPMGNGNSSDVLLLVTDITVLKRNEEILARNKTRYRSFIANSNEAIFGVEVNPPMPTGMAVEEQLDWIKNFARYVECNKICADSYATTIEEFTGSGVYDLESSDAIFEKKWRAFIEGRCGISNFPFSEFDKNGEEHWYELSLRGEFSKSGLREIWGIFRDITTNKRQELALKHSESRYRRFIANNHEGIFNLEFHQQIPTGIKVQKQVERVLQLAYVTECNDVFALQCGVVSAADCIGVKLIDLTDEESARKMFTAFVEQNYQLASFESQTYSKKGGSFWSRTSLEGVIENNLLVNCWGSRGDTTERRKYLEELEYQATHDSLTLLPNRKKLYLEAEYAIKTLAQGKSLVLMLIDLNRFKEINDTLGHHIGDHLLKQLGPRLESVIGPYPGLVARLGGDEFAVMIAGISEDMARSIAATILEKIGETFDLGGFQADISASLGISFYPKHGRDVGSLMRYADVAMYRAKTESLGILEYSPEFDNHTPKRLALMTDLGRAVREDQLHLHFQPKIDLNGEFTYCFEALLRWTHPQHGAISPSEFIPLAETSELIRSLTLWVLDASLKQCRCWRDSGMNVKIAVNLSTRNLLDEQIVEYVENSLRRFGVPATALELEITESAIMSDPKRALIALQKIHLLGVQLSIDDFGTGYSSLAYLKKLPVESLKIDYSFVIDMLNDEQDAIIVRSTINLAHNLGLKVVAEGVENHAILNQLSGMGCDQAQGFYIGKPMPSTDIEAWSQLSLWPILS